LGDLKIFPGAMDFWLGLDKTIYGMKGKAKHGNRGAYPTST